MIRTMKSSRIIPGNRREYSLASSWLFFLRTRLSPPTIRRLRAVVVETVEVGMIIPQIQARRCELSNFALLILKLTSVLVLAFRFILYAITGCVSALFCVVIILGVRSSAYSYFGCLD